jgi:hypothetical protein
VTASVSPLDQEHIASFICELIRSHHSNTSIAQELLNKFHISCSEAAIRRFKKRHQNEIRSQCQEGISLSNLDDGEIVTRDISKLNNPEQMLKDRGLDPKDWEIDGASVNEWTGPSENGKETYHQAKLYIKRKKDKQLLLPARSDGWKAPAKAQLNSSKPRFVVIVADQHAPFHDPRLHELFCSWLKTNKPDEGVLAGDLIDAPDLSKHRLDPENTASIVECLQSAYDLLLDYVRSSPTTKWKYLPGNHCARIRSYIIDHARELYGLKRANEKLPLFDLPYLLRLDELDIEFVDPHGNYEAAQIVLSNKLAIKHGSSAAKNAGSTAIKALEQHQHSIAIGHVHRQALVHRTKHDINGKPSTLVAAEIGCMCSIDKRNDFDGRRFPAYIEKADWQNGWLSACIWPDGTFHLDCATYFDGTVLWRDQRLDSDRKISE